MAHRILVVMFILVFLTAGAALAAKETTTNLAPNPGFEQPPAVSNGAPEGWTYFTTKGNTICLTTEKKHGGEQCLQMAAQNVALAYQGIHVELPVAEGEKYTFEVFVTNSRSNLLSGTVSGLLVIEWKDANGQEITRAMSTSWNAALSRMRWESFSIKKTKAPKGAVLAKFGIQLHDGNAGKGSVLVDDVRIEKD